MTFRRIILLVMALAVLVSGCGREDLFELPHTPLHQISFIDQYTPLLLLPKPSRILFFQF